MEYGWFEVFKMLGSLALFIYGMKIMSDGIQKAAGSKMRKILEVMTTNRFTGVLTGVVTTSVIQSSSATTVMVVSFVNAGLLKLREAISVIMGANIGTTMTAWLVAILGFSKFSIAEIALPILALGLPLLFSKKDSRNSWGEFIIGFSILFIGLQYLKDNAPVIEPEQLKFITDFGGTGFVTTLIFIAIGSIVTVVVQSSSAAMALTLVMLQNGLPLEIAAAIVLGENIGTTITANLAALVANTNAKRAARAHLVFNIFGVIWMFFAFKYFIGFLDYLMQFTTWGSPSSFSAEQLSSDEYKSSISKTLALFHTIFNILNTLLLVWFIGKIEWIVIKMVKSKDGEKDDQHALEYIGGNMMRASELSVLEVRQEIVRFVSVTHKMLSYVKDLINTTDPVVQKDLLEKIAKYEEITDRIEAEVANYISQIPNDTLSRETANELRKILSVVNELEEIGDEFFRMSRSVEKKIKNKAWFLPEQRKGLNELLEILDEAFLIMKENVNNDSMNLDPNLAIQKEAEINRKRKELRKDHLKRLENAEYSSESGMYYSNLFSGCEKVGDHVLNITETLYGKDIDN